MRLFLVRHCQSTGGLPESALTERGHAAAALLADRLIPFGPDAIFASPYARAVSTVSPLATRLQTEINLDDRLRERVRSSEEIEDVVGGVLYLESAPFVTGEVLHIDGGQSAGH